MGRMKTNPGNFFEDFTVGQVIDHATPRTITEGDRALYGAIYPTRFAIPSSAEFAATVGLTPHPVEELIGFHVAFGKTVPDVSLNAVANLGYAEGRFLAPVYPGDTLQIQIWQRGDTAHFRCLVPARDNEVVLDFGHAELA